MRNTPPAAEKPGFLQDRAKTIFLSALEMASDDARLAFVEAECGGEEPLRAEVDELLRHHQQLGSFLQEPAVPARAAEFVALGFLSPSDNPEHIGRLGAYEITGVVGRGGMGVVLKGFDEKLNRVVAIKLLAPELAGNPTARKRFLREAQAAAAVSHPHVITIHAVEEGHVPYLVMELINGGSLEEKIEREGPLPLKEILRIGLQISSGLAAAHAHGLIHRDIKPANILLENGVERVRITDFGLARAVDDVGVTRTGEVTGTPQYMSPEQAEGKQVDRRTDLFSLGSVLYAMCTGRSPFRCETTVGALRRVCDDRPRPIRGVNPDIPRWLETFIDRLLAKDPEERIQTAAEVENLLGGHLAHIQDPAGTPPPASVQPLRPKRSRRWLLAASVLLMGGLGVTEATGVTEVGELVGTVLRIRTPAGTLVLEIDDPNVKVAVEGAGEKLTISGGGIEKLELRPGQYQVSATKDGRQIRAELVTITRGGKQVVKVMHEPRVDVAAKEPVGEVRCFEGYKHEIRSLAFAPDGRKAIVGDGWLVKDGRLTGAFEGSIRLLDLERGQELLHLRAGTRPVRSVLCCPDGRHAVSAGLDLQRWDLSTGEQSLVRSSGLPSGVRAAAFSADGRRALVAGHDRNIRLWDTESGKRLGSFAGHTDQIATVALSEDGKWVLAGCNGDHIDGKHVKPSGNTLRVWRIGSRTEQHCFGQFKKPVSSVAISPDGRYAASGGETARLWDIESGQLVRIFVGHTDIVASDAFSPGGRRILTGSDDQRHQDGDGTVRLWDVESGAELERFPGHKGGVRAVAFSADGRYALSGGILDGTVKLWRLPAAD